MLHLIYDVLDAALARGSSYSIASNTLLVSKHNYYKHTIYATVQERAP